VVEEHLTVETQYVFITFYIYVSYEVVNLQYGNYANIFFKAFTIPCFGMDGHTLEMMNLLAGLMNLRICIIWSLIFIDFVI
jgi:hypothetical protein